MRGSPARNRGGRGGSRCSRCRRAAAPPSHVRTVLRGARYAKAVELDVNHSRPGRLVGPARVSHGPRLARGIGKAVNSPGVAKRAALEPFPGAPGRTETEHRLLRTRPWGACPAIRTAGRTAGDGSGMSGREAGEEGPCVTWAARLPSTCRRRGPREARVLNPAAVRAPRSGHAYSGETPRGRGDSVPCGGPPPVRPAGLRAAEPRRPLMQQVSPPVGK